MIDERFYIVDGYYACRKNLDTLFANVQISVYGLVTHYWVFFNGKRGYEFKTSRQLGEQELLELALETTVEKWGIPNDALEYSLYYCGVRHPNGDILNQHDKAMECKSRLQNIINQDFIDDVNVFLTLKEKAI